MGRFPYSKYFRIYTQKPLAQVRELLKGETAVWGMGHYPLGEGVFVGDVGTSYFKVVPRPTWFRRTYSMAVMEGSIKAEAGETVVDVKVRIPRQMYLLLPVPVLMAMVLLFSSGPVPPIVYKMIASFIAFFEMLVWIIIKIEFSYDSGRGRRDMEELLGESVDIDSTECG